MATDTTALDRERGARTGLPAGWVERARTNRASILGIAFFLIGLVVAERIRPVILYDDAAIIGRYIRRIVAGDGWTYNDGDRTNGLSSPLYGMVGATLHALGLDPIVALRAICSFSYAATIGLVAYLGTRIVGVVGGIASGAFLLLWYDFATQGLSGMESAFATFLGTAVLVAVVQDRQTLAGVLLGLALVNKLDAGLLALAVGASVIVIHRRPPWRMALVSAVVAMPWFVFSTLYFGSPLPYSFTQKADGVGTNHAADRSVTWILDNLVDQSSGIILVVGAMGVGVVYLLARRQRLAQATTLLAAMGWAGAHGAAFSLLDLGDRYPWYLTALYPPISLAAGCAVGFGFGWVRGLRAKATLPALVGVVIVFALITGDQVGQGQGRTLVRRFRQGAGTSDYLSFELARRETGVRLAGLAEPGEVVITCYGWIAYEAIYLQVDESCPLNTREPVGPANWMIDDAWPVVAGVNDVPAPGAVASVYSDGEVDVARLDIVRLSP